MESCWVTLGREESDALVGRSEDGGEGTTMLDLLSERRVGLLLMLRRRGSRDVVPIEDRLSYSQLVLFPSVRLLQLLLGNQTHRTMVHRLRLMNSRLPEKIRQPEVLLPSSHSTSSSSNERLSREHRRLIQLRTVVEVRRRVGVERSDPSMVSERRGMALEGRRDLSLILLLLTLLLLLPRDEELLLRGGRSVEGKSGIGSGSELMLLLDGRREDVLRSRVGENLLFLGLLLRREAEPRELMDGVVESLRLELLLLLLRLLLLLILRLEMLLLLLNLGTKGVLERRDGSSDLRGEGGRSIRVRFEDRCVVSLLLKLGSLDSSVLVLLLR